MGVDAFFSRRRNGRPHEYKYDRFVVTQLLMRNIPVQECLALASKYISSQSCQPRRHQRSAKTAENELSWRRAALSVTRVTGKALRRV